MVRLSQTGGANRKSQNFLWILFCHQSISELLCISLTVYGNSLDYSLWQMILDRHGNDKKKFLQCFNRAFSRLDRTYGLTI